MVPAGTTAFSITVPSNDDAAVEANETVQVSVGGKAATATLTSNDVAQAWAVAWRPTPPSVTEGGNLVVYTVTLTAASPVATTPMPFSVTECRLNGCRPWARLSVQQWGHRGGGHAEHSGRGDHLHRHRCPR